MASVINTNITSLNAQNNLSRSQGELATAIQRLSTGLRINSAKDDAAGMAISERMTTQIRGLNQAARNANDGVSLAQTAEGALGTSSDILQRIRELAVQSANATNSGSDRKALQAEVSQLVRELGRIADTTSFNGKKLLEGSFGTQQFQVGANAGETIQATMANFATNQYGNHQLKSRGGRVDVTLLLPFTIASSQGTQTITPATDSAKAIAKTVNSMTDETGISASAKTEVGLFFPGGDPGQYEISIAAGNGADERITFNLPGASDLINKINERTGKTGITARIEYSGAFAYLLLTQNTGENITVKDTATDNPGPIFVFVPDGLGISILTSNGVEEVAEMRGRVSFDSDASFSISGNDAFALSGAARLQAVATLDISDVDGANRALKIVDSALSRINGQRATFGALQSRFESSVSNIQSASENLSAARSRIMDTDFAAETANLTRAQIVQQASTAMLAQANVIPQNVLSLLDDL